MEKNIFTDVNTYISQFPESVRKLLEELRAIIQNEVPQAAECISYQMPAYKLNGPLVYFAGYKKYIGFYPTSSGIAAFQKQLTGYAYSKGAVQFPLDKPLPVQLIRDMVQFRVKENSLKSKK